MATRDGARRAPPPIPLTLLLLAGLLAGSATGGTAATRTGAKRPPGMSAVEADTLLRSYAKDRAETRTWLKSAPTSYLATILRRDFEDRVSLTVGSAPGNDVHIDDPGVRPRHLRVTVVRDSFRVETLDLGAHFQVKDVEMTSATLPPSGIKVGRFSLRLSHQRFPAIIVFDPQSPRFKLYKGVRYFPSDLSYRIVAALTPNPKPDTTVILSTRSSQRRAVRVGWFEFKVKGTLCRLEATSRAWGRRTSGSTSPTPPPARRAMAWGAISRPRRCRTAATCSTSTAATTRPAPTRSTTTAPSLPARTGSWWRSVRARWTRTTGTDPTFSPRRRRS